MGRNHGASGFSFPWAPQLKRNSPSDLVTALADFGRYVPHIKGSARFQGEMYHTARWPRDGASLKDKRIGVIGTGASGIQVIQEAGLTCKHLTVYQRTPNLWYVCCTSVVK